MRGNDFDSHFDQDQSANRTRSGGSWRLFVLDLDNLSLSLSILQLVGTSAASPGRPRVRRIGRDADCLPNPCQRKARPLPQTRG